MTDSSTPFPPPPPSSSPPSSSTITTPSSPTLSSISYTPQQLLTRAKHPENIVKRVIVADFATGVCLLDWKRPGVRDHGLDDHSVAALIKFFFQFGADLRGGAIRKVVLEQNDFEARYFRERKHQQQLGGASAGAGRNMFRRSGTTSADGSRFHVRSRSGREINANKLLQQQEQEEEEDFNSVSERLYVQCAAGKGHNIYAAVFIDGRDEWMQLAQTFVQRVVDDFSSRFEQAVLALRKDLKNIADGVQGADEVMHQSIMDRFRAFQTHVHDLSKTVFRSGFNVASNIAHGSGSSVAS